MTTEQSNPTLPATASLELKRITSEMDDVEDRLRLVGEPESGEPVEFWLTQRLLKRMLPHLVKWLEPTAKAGNAATLPNYHTDAVQSFAQQAALSQLPQQAPVVADKQQDKWLVETIEFALTPDIIAMTFKGGEHKATLLLAQQPLRQWLAILHDQCRIGEWKLDVWPDWIVDSAPSQPKQVRSTMH